jgi:hypothetical protein
LFVWRGTFSEEVRFEKERSWKKRVELFLNDQTSHMPGKKNFTCDSENCGVSF